MIDLRPRLVSLICAATLLGSCAVGAAPGPGINQVTFQPSEVGKEIFQFTNSVVGAQPTMIDFQHGYLYIGAAHALNNSIPSRINWINISNPRSPTIIRQVTTGGNKPHM